MFVIPSTVCLDEGGVAVMPRFYFYLARQDTIEDDEIGMELPSVEDARWHANRLARQLKTDSKVRVVVGDEDGAPLFAVSPSEKSGFILEGHSAPSPGAFVACEEPAATSRKRNGLGCAHRDRSKPPTRSSPTASA
jgi:hypothetical protein